MQHPMANLLKKACRKQPSTAVSGFESLTPHLSASQGKSPIVYLRYNLLCKQKKRAFIAFLASENSNSSSGSPISHFNSPSGFQSTPGHNS